MKPRKLLWRISLPVAGILLFSLGVTIYFASENVSTVSRKQAGESLLTHARLAVFDLKPLLLSMDRDALQHRVGSMGSASSIRITVVDAAGDVLADSMNDPRQMDNHKERPEIQSALQGKASTSMRFSPTEDVTMIYAAVPVEGPESIIAVVRGSITLKEVEDATVSIRATMVLFGSIIALATIAVMILVTRRILLPLRELHDGAVKFADGDLRHHISGGTTEEFSHLAATLNDMAAQLYSRINTIIEQKNEQKAILESMGEGVLAVDEDERILSLNAAVERLFHLDVSTAIGRSVRECIRHAELHLFLERVLHDSDESEKVISLPGAGDVYVQLRGSRLRDRGGKAIGAVIVLNDVTRLQHLETIRKDFVANVSHELRTPITSIKGYVETLRDSAFADRSEARKFLNIISKHTDRLQELIDDLMTLSRIEADEEKKSIRMETFSIDSSIHNAVAICRRAAELKHVRMHVRRHQGMVVYGSSALLEEALVNLLQNAIKYSYENGEVRIEVSRRDEDIVVQVQDDGCGIAPEHLTRLFERFYRVDRGRDRSSGGSGLGLSIVKHIMHIHGGRVEVESEPQRGSTFSLILPSLPSLLTES